MQWTGTHANKGLSFVAFSGWQLEIDESYDPRYQSVMPLHLTEPKHIRLLAVWDMNHWSRECGGAQNVSRSRRVGVQTRTLAERGAGVRRGTGCNSKRRPYTAANR